MTFANILIAIGANLPSTIRSSPLETCKWAAGQLAAIPGLRLVQLSRWFETQPMPASDQPLFINGVAALSGAIEPHRLLEALHQLEAAAGRSREARNAARALDLDILAMDQIRLDTAALTLPHPRLQHRAFVLAPLADILPEWRHPVLDRTAGEMLDAVSDQGVRPLQAEPSVMRGAC